LIAGGANPETLKNKVGDSLERQANSQVAELVDAEDYSNREIKSKVF